MSLNCGLPLECTKALSPNVKKIFDALHQFVWVQGGPLPLIYDLDEPIYTQQGITRETLAKLASSGLIHFEAGGFVKKKLGKHTRLFYCGKPTKVGFPSDMNNQLDLGCVILTERGKASLSLDKISMNRTFYEYIIRRWYESNYIVTSIQVGQKAR